MPRICASCALEPGIRRELDRKLKSGTTLPDVRRWLAERSITISINALSRHRASHVVPERRIVSGPRPQSTDLLELVRDRVIEDVESGAQVPNVTQGLAAVKQLDDRQARYQDRDIFIKIALAMSGGAVPLEARVIDPEMEEIEAEFRQLLGDGSASRGPADLEQITAEMQEAKRQRERG